MRRHLKLCHTSDWHLGHTLHGHPREHEHERFLAFLLDVLEREAVDALIVAGDVFDTANPPASAQAMFYRFLAEARARLPRLDVVIVAGNHDSAARLGAADPVLRAIGVRIVGAVPRLGAGGRAPVDADAMVVPLHDRNNEVAAWVAAVPYLRPADLPALDAPVNAERADPLVEGVRRVYGEVLDAARARQKPDQALIATGHCHMVDVQRSEDSERPILGGLKHALPVDLFPGDVGYAALGHIHLAQPVGEHEHVRYCGSPIPLSMPEESYPHEVRLVRFEGGVLVGQTKVRVRLSEPVPDLRRQIEAAIGERPVRLVKITTAYTGRDVPLAESAPRRDLGDLQVEEVFRQAYARRYEGDPSPALLRAFHEVAASAARALEEGEA